jgi:hypothetical protein
MRSRHMATVAKRRSGDWYHLEVAPKFAHDPEATKQAFQAVFGVSPRQHQNLFRLVTYPRK